jgi:ABC-type multidrug transport system ATPase subunit
VNVIETHDLGRRYGATWALQECSLTIPAGHLTALVGPNGAGKTTLINLVIGLSTPSAGELTVLGDLRPGSLPALDGIGFVAQDVPLYRGFSVTDMVSLTRNLNRTFDVDYAHERLADLNIDLRKRAGQLSGGQRAQLALTLALARHPRLLVLDEPTASLDRARTRRRPSGPAVRRTDPPRRPRRRPARRAPTRDHPFRTGLDPPRMGRRRVHRCRRADPTARPTPLARGRAAGRV